MGSLFSQGIEGLHYQEKLASPPGSVPQASESDTSGAIHKAINHKRGSHPGTVWGFQINSLWCEAP